MRKSVPAALLSLAVSLAWTGGAPAQHAHGSQAPAAQAAPGAAGDRQTGGDGDRQGAGPNGVSPSAEVAREFEAVGARMHQSMAVNYTGDADADFARAMIPHHQGAIDMARIAARHGTDPEIKRLAQDVIATQEREIAQLKAWLDKRGR
jgi:uncharacterized protein (DUF305 family)